MRRYLALAASLHMTACTDDRSHADLMADATADVETVQLERALARFDSARAVLPDDAEAHRRYAELAGYFNIPVEAVEAWERVLDLEPAHGAAWEGYIEDLLLAGSYETDRRYWEKLLRVLPDALRYAGQRPDVYFHSHFAAQRLGAPAAYREILLEHRAAQPEDQILLHHLGEAQVTVARLEEVDRSPALLDSLAAALDELAARHERDSDVEAPVLYRLAAGYDLLRQEDEKDHWLARLTTHPERGVLADGLRHFDLMFGFYDVLYGEWTQETMSELDRMVEEGSNTDDLGTRAAWVTLRHMAVRAWVDRAWGRETSQAERTESAAVEPGRPPLASPYAERLFDAAMDVTRYHDFEYLDALGGLLQYGIRPRAVLERASEIENALRADRPGYLSPAYLGDRRVREREAALAALGVLQARALAQLGEYDAAGRLFEELATASRGGETLGEYGRHLLRVEQPADALEVLVEALAYGGSAYRAAAEEAATRAGLPIDAVERRLSERRPIVQAEREQKALGEPLHWEAPDLALSDLNGVERRLSDLGGKVVVLKFWADWCGASRAELPHFAELLKKYEGDEGVTFLTVATAGSTPAGVRAVLAELGSTFPVLLDDEGRAVDFRITAYPRTFYLDPDGVIQFKQEGFDETDYERQTAIRIDRLREAANGVVGQPTAAKSR